MSKTHQLTNHPLYIVWRNMNNRCYNKDYQPDYNRYGGRGIRVCDKWRNNFKAFYDDVIEGYRKGLTLDRKDVNGELWQYKYYVSIEESLNDCDIWNVITVCETISEISAKNVALRLSHILSLDIQYLYEDK